MLRRFPWLLGAAGRVGRAVIHPRADQLERAARKHETKARHIPLALHLATLNHCSKICSHAFFFLPHQLLTCFIIHELCKTLSFTACTHLTKYHLAGQVLKVGLHGQRKAKLLSEKCLQEGQGRGGGYVSFVRLCMICVCISVCMCVCVHVYVVVCVSMGRLQV